MKILIAFVLLISSFTHAEPNAKFATGLKKPKNAGYGVPYHKKKIKLSNAAEFDWEAQGVKTPLRNQGNCGSCWAFASTQTLEGAVKRKDGLLLDLAEQQFVDCIKEYYGCGGGWFAGKQLVSGMNAESDYPYTAKNGSCKSAGKKIVAKADSFGFVGEQGKTPTVDQVQNAITEYGYVSVTVGANSAFMNYRGGFPLSCPQSQTNHMVTLVGWKTVNGQVYFKMKNSWGTAWGEKGYGWFRLGCWNMGEEVAFVTYKPSPGPCTVPKVKLPTEISAHEGDSFILAVRPENGVNYLWQNQAKETLSQNNSVDLTVTKDDAVKLTATNACGTASIASKITVVKEN